MGLFSRILAEEGLQRAMRSMKSFLPSEMPDGQWRSMMRSIEDGNHELIDQMGHGSIGSNWEHGLTVRPREMTGVKTNNAYDYVSLPLNEYEDPLNGVAVHSHPHGFRSDNGFEAPNVLSNPDVRGLWRGITAIDPMGSFAYAIKNPRSPQMGPVQWAEVTRSAKKAAAPYKIGDRWVAHSANDYRAPSPMISDEEDFLTTLGVPDAMKRAGMLEQYDVLPGSPNQARTLEAMAPGRAAAADAAEEVIRGWLRLKGYDDGHVKAIIGSLTASGMLGAMASRIMDEQQNA